jgi:transcription antitermination factor NusG
MPNPPPTPERLAAESAALVHRLAKMWDASVRGEHGATKLDRMARLRSAASKRHRRRDARVPKAAIPFPEGALVTVTSGEYSGRAGVVTRVCKSAFSEFRYVTLESKGRERTKKMPMVDIVNLRARTAP